MRLRGEAKEMHLFCDRKMYENKRRVLGKDSGEKDDGIKSMKLVENGKGQINGKRKKEVEGASSEVAIEVGASGRPGTSA
jgi:hypothetical protein